MTEDVNFHELVNAAQREFDVHHDAQSRRILLIVVENR